MSQAPVERRTLLKLRKFKGKISQVQDSVRVVLPADCSGIWQKLQWYGYYRTNTVSTRRHEYRRIAGEWSTAS
jgi:hypothetical protein